MSSCGFIKTIERLEGVDFPEPIGTDKITLMSASKGATENMNLYAYVNIIKPQAWIIFIMAVFILTFSYFILMTFSMERAKFSLGDSMALILLLLAQRDLDHPKSTKSIKIIFLVSVFFGYLTYSYYSAILTSLMATSPPKKCISSFQDVLDYDLSVTTWRSSAMEQYLITADAKSPVNKVYPKNVASVDSYEEQVGLALNQGGLIWGSIIEFSRVPRIYIHDISEHRNIEYGFMLQKDSEFTPLFNYHILLLKQTGVIKQILDIWLNQRKPKELLDEEKSDYFSLGFSNLTFPFLALLLGILISVVLFCTEFLQLGVNCKK